MLICSYAKPFVNRKRFSNYFPFCHSEVRDAGLNWTSTPLATNFNGLCTVFDIKDEIDVDVGIMLYLPPNVTFDIFPMEPGTEHLLIYHGFLEEPHVFQISSYQSVAIRYTGCTKEIDTYAKSPIASLYYQMSNSF